MSMFEKIVIPLIDDNLTFADVNSQCGFLDSYTEDLDKPCGDNAIYLTYDDSIRTDMSMKCASRLEKLTTIRNRYVKIIDNKPVMVYKMYVKSELKKLFTGDIELEPEQYVRIFDFWGYDSDVAKYICSNKRKSLCVKRSMPLEDYVPRFG